jgi:hypothetical protein
MVNWYADDNLRLHFSLISNLGIYKTSICKEYEYVYLICPSELMGPQFLAGIEESPNPRPGPIHWSTLHTSRGRNSKTTGSKSNMLKPKLRGKNTTPRTEPQE